MNQKAEMALGQTGPFHEDSAAGGKSAATVPQAPCGPQQADVLYAERMRQQARHAIVLDSIKAHLEEQPSNRTVLACARRWATDVIRLADEVIGARQMGDR